MTNLSKDEVISMALKAGLYQSVRTDNVPVLGNASLATVQKLCEFARAPLVTEVGRLQRYVIRSMNLELDLNRVLNNEATLNDFDEVKKVEAIKASAEAAKAELAPMTAGEPYAWISWHCPTSDNKPITNILFGADGLKSQQKYLSDYKFIGFCKPPSRMWPCEWCAVPVHLSPQPSAVPVVQQMVEALKLCFDHCRLYHPEVESNNVGASVRAAIAAGQQFVKEQS